MKNYLSESLTETEKIDELNYSANNTSSKKVHVNISVYFYDNTGSLVDVTCATLNLASKEQTSRILSAPCVYTDHHAKEYASYKLVTHVFAW